MVFLKYIFILSLLLLLPSFYIYRHCIDKKNISKCYRYIYCGIDVLIILLLIAFMFHPVRTGQPFVRLLMIIIFVMIFGKLSFSIISIFGKLIFRKSSKGRLYFDYAGIIACVFIIGCVLYSFLYGYKRYCVKEVTVYSRELPKAFDGYRIVQFSDLHIGSFQEGNDKNVRHIVDLINRQRADMIVFTGDLINVQSNELDGFESVLSQLKAPDGVYSVLGNHDYCKYRYWHTPYDRTVNLFRLEQKERSFGWNLLMNEHVMIHRGGNYIVLVGTEDYGDKVDYHYGNLRKALFGLPAQGKGLYKILISHDPTYWHLKVLPESDIQLMLSGHTHAMQFKIGSFSPCQWIFQEWDGLYAVGRRMLYVDTGVGALMSYRFGAWPQISVITLRR